MDVPNPSSVKSPSAQPAISMASASSLRRYYHSLDPLLKKPKNRAYMTTVLSFLVISLFLWYAIRPTVQTILSLRREIRDNIEVNKEMEDKIGSLVEAQATYQQIAGKLPLISQALPDTPNIVPLLLEIKNIANATGATISAVQLPGVPLDNGDTSLPGDKNTTQKPSSIQNTQITMSIDGTYTNMKQFLDAIVTSRRIMLIHLLSMGPLGDTVNKSDPQLRLVLKLDAQYLIRGQQ